MFSFLLLIVFASVSLHAQTYHSLFDGKTLQGWHIQGDGSWRVNNGMIEGSHLAQGNFGHLVTDSSFKNFRLHWVWKLSVGGNSGLYFHSQEGSDAGMIGAQVEMDESFSGGIYTTATTPWGWVSQPSADAARSWFLPGDWNDLILVVNGPRVSVMMNGKISSDVENPNLGTDGHFGIQNHANTEMTIWVKTIEISDVPGSTGLAQKKNRFSQSQNFFPKKELLKIFSLNGKVGKIVLHPAPHSVLHYP